MKYRFLLIFIIGLFLISSVSAFEFDNVKSYDEKNKEITIKNAFGLGKDISKIKLNTPLVYNVIRGKDRLVAEFTINNFNPYSNVFNNMEFYDINKGMQKFEREFVYRYKEFYDIEVLDYETICEERIVNETEIEKYNCYESLIGSHFEERFNWIDFDDKKDLPKGKITLGIFTDVLPNEEVEWIPTLFGVEINEWAVWTESLSVGLVAYWDFENATADSTNLIDNIAGKHNGTLNANMGASNWITGKIGNGLHFNGIDELVTVLDDVEIRATTNLTFGGWVKIAGNQGSAQGYFFSKRVDDTDMDYEIGLTYDTGAGNDYYYGAVHDGVARQSVLMGPPYTLSYNWYFVIYRVTDANLSGYLNGSIINSKAISAGLDTSTADLTFGRREFVQTTTWFNGTMDEVAIWNRSLTDAEISDLWNNGDGITYSVTEDTNSPNVTINTPLNQTYSTNSITFNITSVDDTLMDSCLYSLDNGATNYSMTNLSSFYSATNNSMTQGLHTVNYYCNDSSNNLNDSESITFFIDSINPLISFAYPINDTYNSNISTLNYTYIETNCNYTWYSIDGGSTNSTLETCGTNFTSIVSSDSNTWIVFINDTAGNLNSSNVSFTIDTIPPTIDWISPTPTDGDTINYNSVYLNTTITDASNTSAFFDFNYSLVGYWAMDFYNSTGVFDNSTYDNFGIFYNMSEENKTDGMYGDAFNFSGNDAKSYLDLGNDSSLQPTDGLTIDLWIKPQLDQEVCFSAGRGNGNYGIAGSVDGADSTSTWSWQLTYGAPELCSLGLQLNAVSGAKWVDIGANLSTTEWTHIVATFNGTATKLYVNSILNETNNFAATTISVNTNNRILLGVGGWGVSNTYYTGGIDEFKVFNREISQEEINASYNNNLYRLNYNFTGLSDGFYNYSAYAIDTLGNLNITTERYFIVDLPDTIPPYFITIPNNASLNYSNDWSGVFFNASDESTFDTYGVNDSRFTINSTGYLLNASDLAYGNYLLNISINDTANNINWTIYHIQINQSTTSCQVYFNETSPLTYPDIYTIWTNCSSSYTLAVNGSSISNNSVQNSGAGAYNVSVIRSDEVNYTNLYDEEEFHITPSGDSCQIYFNESSPLIYPDIFTTWTNCSSSYILAINGSAISNNTIQILASGAYNVSVIRSDEVNYTNLYDEEEFQISLGSTAGSIAGTSPLTYTLVGDIEGSESNSGDSDITYYLYRNGTQVSNPDNIILAYGYYLYIYNSTLGENYSASASLDTFNLNINQNTSSCQVYFNDTSPLIHPSIFTTWTNCTSSYTLMINDSSISNDSINVLPVGSYNYSILRDDYFNYTNIYDDEYFIINIGTGEGNLSINSTVNNRTIYRTNIVLIEGELLVGTGNIYIFINGTLFNSGASPLSSTEVFNNITYYEVNLTYLGNVNYTEFVEFLYVNVLANPFADISIKYPSSGSYDYHITEINYTVVNYTSCWYNLNEGGGDVPITCGDNVTGITSVRDLNTWTIYVNNTDGIISSSSVVFRIILPYEYDDLTEQIIEILQFLIVFAGLWIVLLSVKRLYDGDLTLGEVIVRCIVVSLGLIGLLFLGPILINYLISVFD